MKRFCAVTIIFYMALIFLPFSFIRAEVNVKDAHSSSISPERMTDVGVVVAAKDFSFVNSDDTVINENPVANSGKTLINENPIINSGFEDINNGIGKAWKVYEYIKGNSIINISGGYSGNNSLMIENKAPNVTYVFQEVKILPDTLYKVSCYIKTEKIEKAAGAANIWLDYGEPGKGVYTSEELQNTGGNWKFLVFYIKTLKEYEVLTVRLSLGGIGTLNTGRAYFDDINLEKEVDNSVIAVLKSFYVPTDSGIIKGNSSSANSNAKISVNSEASNELNRKLSTESVFFLPVMVCLIIVVSFFLFKAVSSKKANKNEIVNVKNDTTELTDSATKADKSKSAQEEDDDWAKW